MGEMQGGGPRRVTEAVAPLSLTLEGVVVGLYALTNGLLQVPLLHTLDPQVLEAECPRHQSHCPQQGLGPPALPSLRPPSPPLNRPPLHA